MAGPTATLPLWPLPLLAGLLPAAAALVAWALSTAQELVPACNPFVEGCVSVSRAARQGPANPVFRALVLPAAALQALTWIVAARWLHAQGAPRPRALVPIAIVAACALVLYGSFLGVEGEVQRWLRRYGTVAYFGGTCVCMLLAGRALQRLADSGFALQPAWSARALPALLGALVALGLGNALAGTLFDGEAKGRIENVCEWWGSALIVAVFLLLAEVWRRHRVHASLSAG